MVFFIQGDFRPQREGAAKQLQPECVPSPCLPACSVVFLSERALAAAGFGGGVALYRRDGDVWRFHRMLSGGSAEAAAGAEAPGEALSGSFSAKLGLFKSREKGSREPSESAPGLPASGTVLELRHVSPGVVSSCAADGCVGLWDLGAEL